MTRPATKTTLTWDPPDDPGAMSVSYDVLRSDNSEVFTAGATCVESNDPNDTTATDTALPGPGAGLYFLARCENACPDGLGTLGMGATGERSGLVCP